MRERMTEGSRGAEKEAGRGWVPTKGTLVSWAALRPPGRWREDM